MSHLLYLIFRCDGKFGFWGGFLGSKHTLGKEEANNTKEREKQGGGAQQVMKMPNWILIHPFSGSRCICTWSYCSLPAAALNNLFLETKPPTPFFTSDRYIKGAKMEKKTSEAKKKKLLLRPSWKNQSLNRRINLQTKSSDLMAALQKSSHSDDFQSEFPASLLRTQIPCTVDQGWYLPCRWAAALPDPDGWRWFLAIMWMLLYDAQKNCPNHLRIIAGALAFASNSGCISNQRLLAILHENSADEVLKPLWVELWVHSRDRVGVCL